MSHVAESTFTFTSLFPNRLVTGCHNNPTLAGAGKNFVPTLGFWLLSVLFLLLLFYLKLKLKKTNIYIWGRIFALGRQKNSEIFGIFGFF